MPSLHQDDRARQPIRCSLRLLTRLLCAGGLAALCIVAAGCQTAAARSDESFAPISHKAETLAPDQRVEALIVEPAGKVKRRRVRGVINDDYRLLLPELGTFDTQDKTLAQLEQDVLGSFNQGSNLKGTIRLSLVTLESSGLFILPSQETLAQLLGDPHQMKLLEQDNHPLWQWVLLDDNIKDFTLIHSPTMQAVNTESLIAKPSSAKPTTHLKHHDKRAIIAQPAHAILAGQSLVDQIMDARVTRNPVNQHRNLTVWLSPAAATALKTLAQTHTHQPLLIVYQGKCIYSGIIAPYMGEMLVITSGQTNFSDAKLEALTAVFKKPSL